MGIREAVSNRPTEIIGAFAASVLALMLAFGVPLTEPQVVAILGTIGTGIPVITLVRHALDQEKLKEVNN